MIGPRTGVRAGPRVGLAAGISADELGSLGIAGVSRDASSGIYCPASAAEWTLLMAAAGLATGNPGFLWLCQDSATPLADAIGGVTLAENAAPLYQQSVAGWSRKSVGTVDATANQRWSSASASLPDISVTSAMLLGYVGFVSPPAAVRGVKSLGTTQSNALHNAVAPRLVSGANTANGAATLGTNVRPWVNKVNVTATVNTLYTDQEKVTPAFGVLTGKQMQVGSTSGVCASARYLYLALFTGAAAELSDAQVKTLLTTLGWSIPWS